MTPDKSPSGSNGLRITLWFVIVGACLLLAWEIPRRGIDPDELEHLHAACCVWRGEVPYRDFFEHHGPALYYLILPLLTTCGPELDVLWLGRALMWVCSMATLVLVDRMAGRSGGGSSAGLLAAGLLAWTTIFHSKGIELRPDVPAMLLLMVAVSQFTYATGGGSWRRFLVVGVLGGLAMLFTQKSVVPVAGIIAAACVARLVTRDPGTESIGTVLSRVIVPLAGGIAAVWGIASVLFGLAGAASEFWYSTWYQLWIWPVRSSRWDYLRPTLAGDLTVWLAASIEIASNLRQWRRSETWQAQRGVVVVIAALCIVSLAFVKATYPQFYLLWMPFLAALAARRIVTVGAQLAERGLVIGPILAGEGLVLLQAMLWFRAWHAGLAGGLGRLTAFDWVNPCVLLTLAVAMCSVAYLSWKRAWGAVLVLCVGLGMFYGVLRNIDTALWSNRDQVLAIEAVNRQVPADGRVLDGFTGYGALRPHAWYYWWINEYSLALIPEEEKLRLLGALRHSPPAAVLFDRHLELLPPPVVEWIRANYESAEPDVLWLPREDSRR